LFANSYPMLLVELNNTDPEEQVIGIGPSAIAVRWTGITVEFNAAI